MVVDDNVSPFTCTFGIDSPIPLTVALSSYLLFVLKIGPSYMKSRPAYSLKSYIVIYNIFQVFSCMYLIYEICVIDLESIRFWKCKTFKTGDPVEVHFNRICFFTFWLKVTELSETVVFVLRKKQRQVSPLHVFHHCATLFLIYQLSMGYKGGSALYPLLLNCGVHIFMYVYYLMAAILPDHVVAKMLPIKKAITTIQMIQFVLILIQVIVAVMLGCELPTKIVAIYVCIICIFFYMFYDFYRKNYSSKARAAAAAKKQTAKVE